MNTKPNNYFNEISPIVNNIEPFLVKENPAIDEIKTATHANCHSERSEELSEAISPKVVSFKVKDEGP
jgi:hypothetical protein